MIRILLLPCHFLSQTPSHTLSHSPSFLSLTHSLEELIRHYPTLQSIILSSLLSKLNDVADLALSAKQIITTPTTSDSNSMEIEDNDKVRTKILFFCVSVINYCVRLLIRILLHFNQFFSTFFSSFVYISIIFLYFKFTEN